MGSASARFFDYLHGADFYRQLHERAVTLLPPGRGERWVDLGCGPGLVTRLAAKHGYRALGIDRDPSMIALAEIRRGSGHESYLAGDMSRLEPSEAAVVSAASLLILLPDREEAVARMLSHVMENGRLLLVETTGAMRPGRAWQWLRRCGFGGRNWLLLLWALARMRAEAVKAKDFARHGEILERHELLDGMVAAWLIRKRAISAEHSARQAECGFEPVPGNRIAPVPMNHGCA